MKRLGFILVLGLGVVSASCQGSTPIEGAVEPASASHADSTTNQGAIDETGSPTSRGTNTFGSGN